MAEALTTMASIHVDLAVAEDGGNEREGIDFLTRLRVSHPDIMRVYVAPVIDNVPEPTLAQAAIFQLLLAPLHPYQRGLVVKRALETRELARGHRILSREFKISGDSLFLDHHKDLASPAVRHGFPISHRFEKLVYASEKMAELCDLARQAARTELPILIEGETGTGKELLARAIRYNSLRRASPANRRHRQQPRAALGGGDMMPAAAKAERVASVEIRVRGRVQGVGFRPTVWRHARDCGLDGEVLNDGEGVLIRAHGSSAGIEKLIGMLRTAAPPLARISAIEIRPFSGRIARGFRIAGSAAGDVRTEIVPDAAVCPACAFEVLDPFARRYRYPFTNCTHCGPRLTIVEGVPYDRASTTMAPFDLCRDCAAEYGDPGDRRFHAEPIACHTCGPNARLIRFDGRAVSYEQHSMLDDVDAAMSLVQKGEIVAIKALGGYQLACDATRQEAVERLRRLKHREAKPFALMARDVDVIGRYCAVDREAEAALRSPAAPIVLLDANGPERLPDAVAPDMTMLGFMLPSTPLHVLMFRRMTRPVVMTSGNLCDEPQAIDDAEAARKLASIAPYALVHDRRIAIRMDDSVVRPMAGRIRVIRRARGYVPASIVLPEGFREAPQILAYGPELKATFCLIKDGQAILSQHQGDLEDATTYDDYQKNLSLFRKLFDHEPQALACDMHPDYRSTRQAHTDARTGALPLIEVQHHHAHLAACLVENSRPLDAPPVLGIVLDGLGNGSDRTIWGGEFLLGSFRGFERLGTFKPVAMPGGEQASRQPWRNLHAHLMAELGWAQLAMDFGELELFRRLAAKPRATIDAMIRDGLNAPLASSCGRLFDAVAAALGICFERKAYEGEAAMRLEAAVCRRTLTEESDDLAYPITIPNLRGSGLPYLEPLAMWYAILGDLILATPVPVMAARFHKGLAKAIAEMALKLARRADDAEPRFDTVALSGGCFQNRILLEETVRRLEEKAFSVLVHAEVPANDGGVALGQAAIAAVQLIEAGIDRRQGGGPCASGSRNRS